MKLNKILDKIKEIKRNIEYDTGDWSMNEVIEKLDELRELVYEVEKEIENGE